MAKSENFQPAEIWTPQSSEFELEPAIERARRDLNFKRPEKLIHDLQDEVMTSPNGIVYAVLKGDKPEEYSETDALVMFNPFANTATANMLVRTEFIREVAKQADVRDEAGKLKPVIMLASPGLHGSRLKLSRDEKKTIRAGNLGPASREYLKAVSELEYGRVALLGYSQGADLALAGGLSAATANLDKSAMAIGEPAGVMQRSPIRLAENFMHAGPDMNERAKDTKLTALDTAREDVRSDFRDFWASMLYPSNWNLLGRNMTRDSFRANMQTILDEGQIDKIVVAYGSRSTITPAESIEPDLERLQTQVDHDRLLTIKVADGTHAWGENLTVLAKLYLKALV